MSIKAFANTIVIIPENVKEKKTESGILISPAIDGTYTSYGEVLTVGDKVKGVSGGERVLYTTYATDKVFISGKEIVFAKEEDILAIIEEE